MTTSTNFIVRKEQLNDCWFSERELPDNLAEGEVLLKIDRFAFTANNITYAVFGDAMSYWKFFPTDHDQKEWGQIPVWGYADIVQSGVKELAAGERIYGYLPMSSHLIIQPAKLSAKGFIDASAHRQGLPPVYNQYLRTISDPAYQVEMEPWQMLFRPLFMTSFLIEDFIFDNESFGAEQIILSSASSKTSFGLAFCLKHRGNADQKIVGLTSPGNRAFVESLGCYDQVLNYEDAEKLHDVASVYVDMAGDGSLTSRLHHHLDSNMKYSCVVGDTHWETSPIDTKIPGAKPEFFFAPSQIEKRNKDWGPGGLENHFNDYWLSFLDKATGWIQVVEGRGKEAMREVYLETLEGRSKASEGHILGF